MGNGRRHHDTDYSVQDIEPEQLTNDPNIAEMKNFLAADDDPMTSALQELRDWNSIRHLVGPLN
jgi:hypothetical protein